MQCSKCRRAEFVGARGVCITVMLYIFHVTWKCAFQVCIEMNRFTAATLRSHVNRLLVDQRCKIIMSR
jgi:hypothetical protein